MCEEHRSVIQQRMPGLGFGNRWASTRTSHRWQRATAWRLVNRKHLARHASRAHTRWRGQAQPPPSTAHRMASTWTCTQCVWILRTSPAVKMLPAPEIDHFGSWSHGYTLWRPSTRRPCYAASVQCRSAIHGASEESSRASWGNTRPGDSQRMKLWRNYCASMVVLSSATRTITRGALSLYERYALAGLIWRRKWLP